MGQLKMAKRKKITAPVVATPTLDGFVDAQMVALHEAINQGDSQGALRATFLALRWRSVRLATVLGILPLSFDHSIHWESMAIVLRGLCHDAVERHVQIDSGHRYLRADPRREGVQVVVKLKTHPGATAPRTW